MDYRKIFSKLGFAPKENTLGVFQKQYLSQNGYSIEIDFEKELIHYGDKIISESKTTLNFSQAENWVVLECVDRLLEKGYKPENITLEKTYPSGHGHSGRLDICVSHTDGSEYLLIECKTWGKEFEKEFSRMKKDGGQLFTYFKFSNKADVIMLYASDLNTKGIEYRNEIIKIEDDYRSGDVKDFYDKWNQLTKDNGIFDNWVNPYHFISKALTPKLLEPIKQEDSGFIFNRFLEILRHNVVSDKPNAFNKIFTLFLCKIYDEKITPETEELKFQWLEGKDNNISFQMRLADLYKNGMYEFLEKKVTDFSEREFEEKYASLFSSDEKLKNQLKNQIIKLRLEKNNEFAIKEVFDEKSFIENAKVVKEVVELLQGFKIRYTKKQQYLSDFFELLLTTGLKQESGQFFTPVPIAQFIIKSIPVNELIDEKLLKGEKNNLLPYVMDYAAGSGHFLTEMMHEVQRAIDQKKPSKYISDTAKKIKNWQEDHFDWALQYVYGVEKDYRLVKVGKVGCYLHGDGLANVIHSDGLSNFKETEEYKDQLAITDIDFPKENKQFDLVVSNPPYSVQAFKQNARSYYTEKDFELYENLTDNSSEIECLFIERASQLLKDGGMAGIILPSSILSNTGIYTKAREIILQNFEIIAITELGSNTFMATGTNTVVLFLRRKNNYDSINLRKSVNKFFSNLHDVTLNGIETPVSKYVTRTWEDISFGDYKTLLQKQPNEAIEQHEIYTEYQKKIKAKNSDAKWNEILTLEKEKIFYFILTCPQKVVLVKSGKKKKEKEFLGYEFSNRRGSEGIHPIQREKSIDECTQLFDADIFDNPEKASTYIYKSFRGNFDFPIDECLKGNISHINLADMLTFDQVDFEKNISLTTKKKITFESKYPQVRLDSLTTLLKRGKSAKYGNSKIQIIKSGQARGLYKFDFKEKHYVSKDFLIDERKLQNGDLLLNSSGVGTAGRVTYFDLQGDFVADNHITILRFKIDLVNPKYAVNVFSCIGFKNLERLALGQSGQIEMSNDTISRFKIPVPPKEIQEIIVSEIKILEQKKENSIEKIENLKTQITKVIKSSSGTLVKLAEITSKIGSGATPRGGESAYKHEGINLIRSQNIYDQGMIKKGLVFIDDTQAKKLDNVTVEPNDVLFNITGASVCRCCIVESDYLPARVNQHVSIIRANEKVSPVYLHQILVSPKIKTELLKIAESSSTREAITKLQLEEFKIPLPSSLEQKKIASEIEKIGIQITDLEKGISTIPEKKEAILKKYLE